MPMLAGAATAEFAQGRMQNAESRLQSTVTVDDPGHLETESRVEEPNPVIGRLNDRYPYPSKHLARLHTK